MYVTSSRLPPFDERSIDRGLSCESSGWRMRAAGRRPQPGLMADTLSSQLAPFPSAPERTGRPGLRREIGFIGLLWASGGSIIGSGWLFGAQGALSTAGPAAIISWAIGAIAI